MGDASTLYDVEEKRLSRGGGARREDEEEEEAAHGRQRMLQVGRRRTNMLRHVWRRRTRMRSLGKRRWRRVRVNEEGDVRVRKEVESKRGWRWRARVWRMRKEVHEGERRERRWLRAR